MTVYVVDPDLEPDTLRNAIGGAGLVYTLFNSHQVNVIDRGRLAPPCPYDASYARTCYEQMEVALAESKTAQVAKVELGGLDRHEIDLTSILETGWGVDIHASLACRLNDVEPTTACIVTARQDFATVCASHLQQRGFEVTLSMQASPPESTNQLQRVGNALRAVGRMAPGWLTSKPRVYAANHRQTKPFLDILRRNGSLTVGTPHLSSMASVLTRPLSAPSEAEIAAAHAALTRLQRFGEQRLDGIARVGWRHLVATLGDHLVATLSRISKDLTNLDILAPEFLVAPNWAGAEAHAMRAWAASCGRPFAVVQHGFNLGAWNCPVSSLVDADIFYAWSPWFARTWIDHERNRSVEIVALGNPAYEGVRPQIRPELRSVLFAPSGVSAFGHGALWDFWELAFQVIRHAPAGLRWRLRPHQLGGSSGWIRARAAALGAEWSTEPTFGEALRGVDIVVTTVSSAAMDAIMHGSIAVVVNTEGREPFYLPDIVGAYLTRHEELEPTLRELITSPRARQAARDRQQFALDEHLGSRPASAIAGDITHRF